MNCHFERSRKISRQPSPFRFILFVSFLIFACSAFAQQSKVHLSVSATAGTTGIGGEIAVQPHPWVTVRAGGAYMPKISVPRSYGLAVGGTFEALTDKDGNVLDTKFGKMAEFMEDLSGYRLDQYVRMNRRPVMNSGHLIVDVHPLKNKNWHASAGLYFGGRHFITGENALNEAPTLVAVCLYNNIYQKVMDGETIHMGSKELPIPASIQDMIRSYGRVSVHLGNYINNVYDENGNLLHQAGDKFLVEPDENCEITADCRINKVRPYVGLGYMGAPGKYNAHWKVGFDIGAMIWGGHPSIIATRTEHVTTIDSKTQKPHTTTKYYELDVTREVNLDDVWPTIKRETNFIKALKVYPVLELKLSYNIF